MRQEPAIDRHDLARTIRENWGIAADDLRHIPAGEYGFCYAVAAGEDRWFAKIWPEPRPGYVSTESTVAMLKLTRLLHDREAFVAQPPPVPTRSGDLSVLFEGRLMALFPFLSGAEPVVDAAFADAFGRRIATLHAATPLVADLPLPRDPLDVSFAGALSEAFDFLDQVGPHDSQGRRAARDLVLPLRDGVVAMLDRLDELGERVRAAKAPFVLCHRDIGAHNIIAPDDGGELFFVDWDDVGLAPPEHDLFGMRGPHFATTLSAYVAAGGLRPLSVDRFAFVFFRRVLDDMNFRLRSIMLDKTGADEDHEVYGLRTWVVPDWLGHAQVFAEMTTAIEAAGAGPR